jgi:hypothetical protein
MDASEDAVGEMGASRRFEDDFEGDLGCPADGDCRPKDSNALILDCKDAAGITEHWHQQVSSPRNSGITKIGGS